MFCVDSRASGSLFCELRPDSLSERHARASPQTVADGERLVQRLKFDKNEKKPYYLLKRRLLLLESIGGATIGASKELVNFGR